MLRIVTVEDDASMAVGGAAQGAHRTTRTWVIDHPELEQWLTDPKRHRWQYVERSVVGIAVEDTEQEGAETPSAIPGPPAPPRSRHSRNMHG